MAGNTKSRLGRGIDAASDAGSAISVESRGGGGRMQRAFFARGNAARLVFNADIYDGTKYVALHARRVHAFRTVELHAFENVVTPTCAVQVFS